MQADGYLTRFTAIITAVYGQGLWRLIEYRSIGYQARGSAAIRCDPTGSGYEAWPPQVGDIVSVQIVPEVSFRFRPETEAEPSTRKGA